MGCSGSGTSDICRLFLSHVARFRKESYRRVRSAVVLGASECPRDGIRDRENHRRALPQETVLCTPWTHGSHRLLSPLDSTQRFAVESDQRFAAALLAPDGAVPQCSRCALAAFPWSLRPALFGFPLRTS